MSQHSRLHQSVMLTHQHHSSTKNNASHASAMPKLPCLVCGVPSQRSRCAVHQVAFDRAQESKRNRPSSTARGYDSDWIRVRIYVLERDRWTCQKCGKRLFGSDATVDHIIPLSKNGARLDPSNLQALCRKHNSAKKDRLS